MCQKCEQVAGSVDGLDQDKFNDEVRQSTRVIDGRVFLDADVLAMFWAETMKIGVPQGNVDLDFMVRAWIPIGAIVSRAEALAEVDNLTASVAIPDAPQDDRLF